MNIEPLSSLDEILSLLTDCRLPVADISAASPPLFFGIRVAGVLVAVVGLELFHSIGLLRSLAVSPTFRGRGLAQELLAFAEVCAASHGTHTLFLLTTTAEEFFLKFGYVAASRQDAAQAIQATPQFSGLCPSSAACLSKQLIAG
jgi:amino-acid N-acetyltransferase